MDGARRQGRLVRAGGMWLRFFSAGDQDFDDVEEGNSTDDDGVLAEDNEEDSHCKAGSVPDSDDDIADPCALRMVQGLPPKVVDCGMAGEISRRLTCSEGLLWLGRVQPGVNSLVNECHMVQGRELGLSAQRRFSHSERCHISQHFLPLSSPTPIDSLQSRAYIGQFSEDGALFVGGFQDRRIRLYDVERGWRLRKDVVARNLRWTITDTALTPDQRFLVYSSITPVVNLVNVGNADSAVESLANVTDIHEALDFSGTGEEEGEEHFGLWSVAFSWDGREVLAGSSCHCLHIYDLEASRALLKVPAHEDDVNSVCFAGRGSSLLCSASDDCLIKVWDRRTLSSAGCSPAGVLVGHLEGLTHLSSRGDGRHLLSNSKDQTLKLWDLRVMRSPSSLLQLPRVRIPRYRWDYRWMEYPGRHRPLDHPHDQSLATFRGHQVLQTLIRAYFSPEHTTAQRFVYTGSSDGRVCIFDVLTGVQVASLEGHEAPVRDCSWHPFLPLLASASWDGQLLCWGSDAGMGPRRKGGDGGGQRATGDAIRWEEQED